jgi:hypothetical protein
MARTILFLLVVLCPSIVFAQQKVLPSKPGSARRSSAETRSSLPDAPEKLPVRRVVLYRNGVGYFEHLGRVSGSQDVHIDFTSAQLNDVLKSLTVLDLSGGRITGVDYNSEAPLARRLATLRLALGERPTQSEFLGTITPEMAQALQKIAAQKAIVGRLEQDMEDRQKDIDRIVADQARLRENMQALRGSSEEKALLQRYTGELDQQETQLDTLRNNIQSTEAQRDKANGELETMIDNVHLEAAL